MLDYSIENEFFDKGYEIICGTDEAGRGPLAGPVYAAAVILPMGLVIDGLNDSKKISEKKREKLFDIIKQEAVCWAIASASPAEIDEYNILNASQLAMRRAVAQLEVRPSLVLVDGNVARGFDIPTQTVIKGDAKSPNIAAASILAKVERDRYCAGMHERYPDYGFDRHKGYPTKEHMDKVRELGPCPEHRRSFLGFLDK